LPAKGTKARKKRRAHRFGKGKTPTRKKAGFAGKEKAPNKMRPKKKKPRRHKEAE